MAFYENTKNKNTDGLLSMIFNSDLSDHSKPTTLPFTQSSKPNSDKKYSAKYFNNYSLQNFFLNNDGGFIVTAASHTISYLSYTNSNTSPANPTLNYSNWNPSLSYALFANPDKFASLDKSLYGITIGDSYSNYSNWPNYSNSSASNYSETNSEPNIVSFSFDGANHFSALSSVNLTVGKTGTLTIYTLLKLSDRIVFIYHGIDRDKKLLNSISIMNNGTTILNPLFRNLDKGYTFLIERGKQVDDRSIIIPCYKNAKLSFAKITFE